MKKIFFFFLSSVLLFSCHHPEKETAEVIKNAVTDVDGNKYDAVKIGDQVWMASNLKTTHYPNGDTIHLASPELSDLHDDVRIPPAGDMDNVEIYGYLYTHRAATRVCPEGWHLPNGQEWYDMEQAIINNEKYLEKSTTVAKALASEKHWNVVSDYGGAGFQPSTNNSTGFSALPASYIGSVNPIGDLAAFWTSETNLSGLITSRFISAKESSLKVGAQIPTDGLSVRCVKD